MSRVKNFVATGIAPDGRLYAGDLNSMQDHYADLSNYSQTVALGTLKVGDTSIMIVKYGTGEMRITSALRTDGILRGLGGIFAGTFTSSQRDAIAAGSRPYGLIILNTTTNTFQWNAGTDAVPNWQEFSGDLSLLPTADQKAALAGTGTPNSGNKYVTYDTLLAAITGVILPGSTAGGDLSGTYPDPTVKKSSVDFSLAGVISPTSLSADQNNYNPTGLTTANFVRLTSSGTVKITGIVPNGAVGRLIVIHNIGTKKIRLSDEDSGSSAENRFALGADISLNPDDTCIIHYDLTSTRWRCIGVPPSVVIPPAPLTVAELYGTDTVLPGVPDSCSILVPFVVNQRITVTKIGIRIHTADGNIDIGILDRAGNKVVSLGSIVCPAAGNYQADIADTGLDPGSYWVCFNASSNDLRWEGQKSPFGFLCRQVNGFFPIPSSVTPGSSFPDGAPSFVIMP